MSGEEGATFPEKLWWAVDEAKARLDTENIGKQYDRELLFVDEENNIQLLLFGMLADNEADVLPGHLWVSRETLEVQNMKYTCPKVLQSIITEMQGKISQYQELAAKDAGDIDGAKQIRLEKEKLGAEIENLYASQTPLKWVNRVIMWCADKMPSFAKGLEATNPKDVVDKAMNANSEIEANNEQRQKLLALYKK